MQRWQSAKPGRYEDATNTQGVYDSIDEEEEGIPHDEIKEDTDSQGSEAFDILDEEVRVSLTKYNFSQGGKDTEHSRKLDRIHKFRPSTAINRSRIDSRKNKIKHERPLTSNKYK